MSAEPRWEDPLANPAALTGRLWLTLFPRLLPLILVAYALSGMAVWLQAVTAQETALVAAARAVLLGLASWLGQVAAARVVLNWCAGTPEPGPAALRAVLQRPGRLVLGALARASVIYAPVLVAFAVAAAEERRLAAGGPMLAPLAALVLLPLAANVAGLLAPAAPVAAVEAPLNPWQLLGQARRYGDRVWGYALLLGGGLLLLILPSSFLPWGGRLWLLPNHLLGSLLWVLLAVLYRRAQRLLELDTAALDSADPAP